MNYCTFFLPTWVCKTCGRVYVSGLNNKCMVCRINRVTKKEKEQELPPRWQYRDLPTYTTGRTYYETDINLDWYKEDR